MVYKGWYGTLSLHNMYCVLVRQMYCVLVRQSGLAMLWKNHRHA